MERKRNRKTIILVVLILLVGLVGGAAAAIGLGLDEEVAVAYGEVDYVNSDLVVEDYALVGNGVNTDSVDVTINNTGTNTPTADTTVYLLDGSTVIAEGTATDSWNSEEEKTVNVAMNTTVKEFEFDSVDIRVKEQ